MVGSHYKLLGGAGVAHLSSDERNGKISFLCGKVSYTSEVTGTSSLTTLYKTCARAFLVDFAKRAA